VFLVTLSTTTPLTFEEKTTQFSCLISTHPGSPLRVLYRLMWLHLGHVTLPEAKFQPPKLYPQSDLWLRAASRWARPQISSVLLCYVVLYSIDCKQRSLLFSVCLQLDYMLHFTLHMHAFLFWIHVSVI